MTIRARLGSTRSISGLLADTIGGQALEAVEVSGDEVITTWAGIAGAGVGVAACLPQAPGVIRAEYPTEDDLKDRRRPDQPCPDRFAPVREGLFWH